MDGSVDSESLPGSIWRAAWRSLDSALERCDRLGIAREQFYEALDWEQRLFPFLTVSELLNQTLRRLRPECGI